MRTLPWARASTMVPAATRSSYDTISALMKPRWKSVWMAPAASGAEAGTTHNRSLARRGNRLPDRLLVLEPRVFLLQPRQFPVDGLEVGDDQLGVDRLDVVARRHLAVHVHHVLVVERPDHLADRVRLADVGEERVAPALALRRAPDQAGDVDARHRRRHDP